MRLHCRALALLATVSVCAGHARAQLAADCKAPAQLESALSSQPSSDVYDALGAYFGKRGDERCALSAFRQAVLFAPGSWEAQYNLGIALLRGNHAGQAVPHLQAAMHLKADALPPHLALGLALNETGRPEAAVEEFKAALKIDPHSAQALDGLAKALIAEKRYSAAIAYLQAAPSDEVLQLDMAIAYAKNGNPEKAAELLTAIVKSHPEYSQAHSNLGIVYTQQQRFQDAAREFQEALRLDPGDDSARVSLVKSLVILAQFEAALPLVRDYYQGHPKSFEAVYLLGVVERGLGDYKSAEVMLRSAVLIDPGNYDVRYNLGFVLARNGKPAEAREQLEAALKLKPDSSESQFQLALVLKSLGQQDEAKAELKDYQAKKEASVKEDVAGVRANQANVYLQSGEVQKAVDLYREAIADDPSNARTYYNLALALDGQRDYAHEREALEKAVALDGKFAPAHNQLGFLSLQSGEGPEAESQFKTAIALDPQYAEAESNLGVLYGQQGKNSEAEQLFRQATENNPRYAQAYINLGLTLASESRFSEADKALESALSLAPDNTTALTARGMVLTRLTKTSEGTAAFQKVVALDSHSPGAHLNLGIALADQFDLTGALAQFSEAARLDPQSSAAHYNVGRALVDLRRNGEATPELESAVRLDPNSAQAWYLLGLIARQSGDTDGSIRYLKTSLEKDPEDATARYMLGQQLLHQGDKAGAAEQWKLTIKTQPSFSEAIYSLSRLLSTSDPDESKRLMAEFEALQMQQHIMDRAQTLGNFALTAADARDWPQAVADMKEGLQVCAGSCSAQTLLHKDLGLIYCRSGNLKAGRDELMEARKLSPADPEIAQALHVLDAMQK